MQRLRRFWKARFINVGVFNDATIIKYRYLWTYLDALLLSMTTLLPASAKADTCQRQARIVARAKVAQQQL